MTEKKYRRYHPCVDCGKPCDIQAQRCGSCASKYRWKTNPVVHHKGWALGENNANWKGGRCFFGSYAYIYVATEHPRKIMGRYVAEHILVWEKANGKPLPEGWIIHHLNGIKTDNRPSNLEALPNKKHYLVLRAKAKRIQELEALLNGQGQLL